MKKSDLNSGTNPSSLAGQTAIAIELTRGLSGFSGYQFNPQALIKAANYLRDLGRDAALEALRRYCVLAAQYAEIRPENALLAARVLFGRKDGEAALPRLPLGQPDFPEPQDTKLLPLFPLHLYRDMPFLLVGGYTMGGESLPPSDYIDWCARECIIRSDPLTPANNPLRSVDQFLESGVGKQLNFSRTQKGMLRLQTLRAVSRVYSITEQDVQELLAAMTTQEAWEKHCQAVGLLGIRWNAETNEYERSKEAES